jgi:hypothetical protein
MIRADRRTMWVFNFILPRLCMNCSLVGGYRSHDPPHNLERRIFFFLYVWAVERFCSSVFFGVSRVP